VSAIAALREAALAKLVDAGVPADDVRVMANSPIQCEGGCWVPVEVWVADDEAHAHDEPR